MNERLVKGGDMLRMSNKGFMFPVTTVVLVLVGCAGEKVAVKSAPQIEQYRVTRVVVLPFQAVTQPQTVTRGGPELSTPPEVVKSDISVPSPDGGPRLGKQTTTVPPGAEMKVARIFTRKLRMRESLTVVPPDEVQPELAKLRAREPELPVREMARRLALQFKADAAVQGLLRVYKEREGSKYGAAPAAVGFEVNLVATDGRVIWKGNYYEQQRPANEDITGVLDRGVGFVRAEDLADYGAEKLVKQFPFGD